jgi:N-acyl-D-amino-acid deacylase
VKTPEPAELDLVLAGGTLIDGSADAGPHVADVGIRGDTIVDIGEFSTARAKRRIDVAGLVVAPGFIDPHTHAEIALTGETDDAHAPAAQGVTTVLTSPDGFGWAPLPREDACELWAATAGIYGGWPDDLRTDSIAAYLGRFEGRTEVNVLPQVPHSAVRYAALGWADDEASGKALDRMRGLVGEWLDVGATGLAVGLEYEPGSRSSTAELIRLCEVVADRGGSLAAHIRYLDIGREAGYREVIEIGRATGVSVNIAHETLDPMTLGVLAETPAEHRPAIETYLYPATSTNLATDVPRADRIGGPVAIARRLADPAAFARVEVALAHSLGADLRPGGSVFAHAAKPERIGRDLHSLAMEAGIPTARLAAQVLRDDPEALFVFQRPNNAAWTRNAKATIANPAAMIASDGIYRPGRMHPRGYGTFPRALRLANRAWGTLDLPAAVHLMTGRTAARYRVPNRGVLLPGAIADIVVFDPAKVAERSTFAAPRRLPAGIRHVFVNGVPVVVDGRATRSRPGRVLAASAFEQTPAFQGVGRCDPGGTARR